MSNPATSRKGRLAATFAAGALVLAGVPTAGLALDALDGSGPIASDGSFAALTPASVDPRLLEVLVCPVTHGPLDYDRAAGELISKSAKLAYPIRDGVPIMLPEEARDLS